MSYATTIGVSANGAPPNGANSALHPLLADHVSPSGVAAWAGYPAEYPAAYAAAYDAAYPAAWADAVRAGGRDPAPAPATGNLFFLDWDDTVLPTFELRKTQFTIPNDDTRTMFNIYSCCVIQTLEKLMEVGDVVIVTNSVEGWVEKSCQMFLPLAWPLVQDIPTIYARTPDDRTTDVLELSNAKFTVFKHLVQTYHPTNIFSVGDGLYERDALWNLLGEGVLRKCLKFRQHPSLIQLATQHDLVLQRLEEAISRDQDFEWVFYDPAEM